LSKKILCDGTKDFQFLLRITVFQGNFVMLP